MRELEQRYYSEPMTKYSNLWLQKKNSSFLKWKKLRTEKPINDTRGTCFVNVFKAGDISAKFKYGKTELLQFLKK